MIRRFAFCALILLSSRSAQAGSHAQLLFAGGTVRADITWTSAIEIGQEATMWVEWKDATTGAAIERPGIFKVWPYMPAMGHGSSPTRLRQMKDEGGNPVIGVYIVERIFFTMKGEWVVNLTVTYPNGKEETQAVKVFL